MSEMRFVGLKLAYEKVDQIQQEADRKGQSLSGMIRTWLYEKLEEINNNGGKV